MDTRAAREPRISGVILANSVVFTNRHQHRLRHGSLEVQLEIEEEQRQ